MLIHKNGKRHIFCALALILFISLPMTAQELSPVDNDQPPSLDAGDLELLKEYISKTANGSMQEAALAANEVHGLINTAGDRGVAIATHYESDAWKRLMSSSKDDWWAGFMLQETLAIYSKLGALNAEQSDRVRQLSGAPMMGSDDNHNILGMYMRKAEARGDLQGGQNVHDENK